MKTLVDELLEDVDHLIAEQRYNPKDHGLKAQIFWELMEIIGGPQRYEAIAECELRGMLIPRKFREFAQIFRACADWRERREQIDNRLRGIYGRQDAEREGVNGKGL